MARYPIKMLLDKDLGPFIPYLPSNSVVVEGTNKTVADQIIDLHNEINERITNVYRFKGSVTFENLPTTGQTTGDVYDITNDFTLDGKQYPAGTNVAWTTDHWDALTGMFSMTSSYEILKLSTAIMSSVRSMYSTAFTVEANKNAWLRMINDAIKANKGVVHFITDADEGYTFKLHVVPAETGTVESILLIYPPVDAVVALQYGESYWISKKIRVTYTDGIATNVAIQTSSGHSYHEMQYAKLKNTTAFTPTATTHLVTKGYVDNTVAKYTTMPTASASNLGSVAQYIGTTDTTYTKGHFYESVVDGSSNYSWQEVNFGGGSGGSNIPIAYLDNPTSNFQPNNINDGGTIDSDDVTSLINICNDMLSKNFKTFILVINKHGLTITSISYLCQISSYDFNLLNFHCIGAYNQFVSDVTATMVNFYIAGSYSGDVVTSLDNYVGGGGGLGKILYADNTNAWTPTGDYNPATKLYVDGEDLTAYVEPVDSNETTLTRFKLRRVGKQFFMQGFITATNGGSWNVFNIKMPSSYLFNNPPASNSSIPVGVSSLVNFGTPTSMPVYSYLAYNTTDNTIVTLKFSRYDTMTHTPVAGDSIAVSISWTYED